MKNIYKQLIVDKLRIRFFETLKIVCFERKKTFFEVHFGSSFKCVIIGNT